MTDMKSQRRTERVPAALPLRWKRRKGDLKVLGADINAHGLFLLAREVAEVGTLLHLEVELPEQTISMFVTVRFVQSGSLRSGMGVQIFAIGEEEKVLWIDFYRALLRRQQARRALPPPIPQLSAP